VTDFRSLTPNSRQILLIRVSQADFERPLQRDPLANSRGTLATRVYDYYEMCTEMSRPLGGEYRARPDRLKYTLGRACTPKPGHNGG
jgi:hypothetical protein